MSEYIPFEIQTDIIKNLPVKSLIQFRSVSKSWKSLIDSSKFIVEHSVRHNQPHHLLVRWKVNSERKCISIVDNDDNFPQMKSSITAPETLNVLNSVLVLDSSHGILCFYCSSRYQDNIRQEMVVLWNPSIRKSVRIDIPNFSNRTNKVGFGVCPITNDIKLVKITTGAMNTSVSEVQVFTVSSGVWRSIPINKQIFFHSNQTFIDGVIYWHAYDNPVYDGSGFIISSFDLTSEEFGEILLPDCLVHTLGELYTAKLMESLVVVKGDNEADKSFCNIWMLSHGVKKSFTKLYNIVIPNGSIDIGVLGVAFRKNGEVILDIYNMQSSSTTLLVVEPCSKHIRDLGIFGNWEKVTESHVTSYTETLLLLNQSDFALH